MVIKSANTELGRPGPVFRLSHVMVYGFRQGPWFPRTSVSHLWDGGRVVDDNTYLRVLSKASNENPGTATSAVTSPQEVNVITPFSPESCQYSVLSCSSKMFSRKEIL